MQRQKELPVCGRAAQVARGVVGQQDAVRAASIWALAKATVAGINFSMMLRVWPGSLRVPMRKFSTPNRWYPSVQLPNALPQTAASLPNCFLSSEIAFSGVRQAGASKSPRGF